MPNPGSTSKSHTGGLFNQPPNSDLPSPTSQPDLPEMPATTTFTTSPLGEDLSTNNSPITSENSSAGAKRKREEAENNGAGNGDGEWQIVNRRKKKAKKQPGKDSNNYPAITFAPGQANLTAKIKISDLRDLIVYLLADGHSPQWVAVKNRNQFRKAVVLYVPGLEEALFKEGVDFATFMSPAPASLPTASSNEVITSPDDYYPRPLNKDKLADELKPFADMFPHLWPVTSPGDSKHGRLYSPVNTFMTTQLSKRERELARVRRLSNWQDVRTPITKYLVTREQMVQHGYPMHPALLSEDERKSFTPMDGYYYTPVDNLQVADVPEDQIEAGSITAGRHILAIDCEMVHSGSKDDGTHELLLARISIITWSGDKVMDKLVQPNGPISDYATLWSGITPDILKDVTTTVWDIQEELKGIIMPNTILVGHSLESDLKAMKFSHPFLVDTALLYPHSVPSNKAKLKDLSSKYLKRQIQGSADGHDPTEDAQAALDLVQLKCQKGPNYGVPDTNGINLFKRLKDRSGSDKVQGGSSMPRGTFKGKKTAAVDWSSVPMRHWGSDADIQIGCANDSDVEAGVIRSVKGDPDGREVPGGGVDFVFARFRELEKLREWDRNPTYEQPHMVQAQTYPVRAQITTATQNGLDEEQTPRSPLAEQLQVLSSRLMRIHDALPPCTAFMLFTGQGNAVEHQFLFSKQNKWKYYENNNVSMETRHVKWTLSDEEALMRATARARQGIGFVGVK